MSDAFNVNQFNMAPIAGQLALEVTQNQSVVTCILDPDSSATAADLVPGVGLKLVDQGSGDTGNTTPPIVDIRTSDGDTLFGVLLFNTKGAAEVGKPVEVALDGAFVWLEAGAALARGAYVALDQSAPGEIIAVGSATQVGRLIDKAAADGDLVRTQIKIVEA